MELPKRRNIRLRKYDYSTPGYYFITVCANNRKNLFGVIQGGIMHHSVIGQWCEEELAQVEAHRPNVKIEKWVVMPNHIHAIIRIVGRAMTCHGRNLEGTQVNQFAHPVSDSISAIVGAYKAAVTRRARGTAAMISHGPTEVWQAGFYEHVLRTEKEYLTVWRYIDENPLKWSDDEYYA